jgi:hypothetical protein
MSLIKVKGSSIDGALAAVDGSALTGISGGKILQVVRSTLSSTTYTTSSSFTTFFDGAITPANSNNYIYALLTYGVDLYGASTTEPQGAIRIVEGSSNTKSDMPLRTTNPGNSQYEREGGAMSGYWQAGGTSALDINVNVNCDAGRVGLWGNDGHTNATTLTLFEIGA